MSYKDYGVDLEDFIQTVRQSQNNVDPEWLARMRKILENVAAEIEDQLKTLTYMENIDRKKTEISN